MELDIQRFADGKVVISTELDTNDFKKGLDRMQNSAKGAGASIKGIVAGLGITKMISAAFNTIRGSMDGAIQRIDTFNQYPKVLSNFGVSAEEASKSIKRIDKSVRGLPTSLDQAVGGVQNLFMVTKDLPKAEKLFKAVNDSAMVFANGSTEAVDRFSYAFKQAMSSGKVSAQDFNQMNEAIPGLMDKVAESMGKTYRELKEGLSDGSISMDQFNNALLKLDTEGGAGMKALEQSAKSATGGIKTSLQNAKTAITRGVADMIQALNKSLKKAKLGSIQEIIAKLGKAFEKELKKISSMLAKIDFKKLIKAFKTLIPIISAVVTAMVAYKTAVLGIKAVNYAKTLIDIIKYFGVMIGAINSATISQNALNIAQSMSPVGIVLALVGALATMVGVYKALHPETDKNLIATKKLKEEYKSFNDELKNNKEIRKSNIEDAEIEGKNAENLLSKIEELSKVENKNNYQKQEMARLVKELNEIMPELNLQYDKEKDKLNMSTEAIRNNIKAQKDLNIAKAYQKNLKSIAEDIAKAEIKASNATTEHQKNVEAYNKAKKKFNDFHLKYDAAEITSSNKLRKKAQELTKEYQNTEIAMKGSKKTVDDYNNRLKKLNSEYDNVSKSAEKYSIKADLTKLISQAEKAGVKIPETLKTQIQKGFYDIPQTMEQLQNLINFDKAINNAHMSGQKIPQEISQQIMTGEITVEEAMEQVRRWLSFQAALQDAGLAGKKIPENIKQGILSGKIKPGQAIDEITKDTKTKSYNGGKKSGENFGQGFIDGMDKKIGDVGKSAANLGAKAISSLANSIKEGSPSKITRQSGNFFGQGFILGIKDMIRSTVKTVSNYGSSVIEEFEKSTDMTSSINKMQRQMESAVKIQQGKMSTNVQTGKVFNSLVATTPINVNLNAGVELDGQKVGRLITPEVSRTIKSGGGI